MSCRRAPPEAMEISLKDKWKSWRRNAGVLFGDVSYSRNIRILGIVILVSIFCFFLLWCLGVGIKAEVDRQDGCRHILTFHEYLFSVLGAIDADPSTTPVYAMYSATVRLIGMVLIGGVLTSFLCSLLARFSNMTLRGLLVPALADHVVIVGYTALTDDLIRMLLSDGERNSFDSWYPYGLKRKTKDTTKILLYTTGDVQNIRDTLNSVLDSDMERRVVYAFGDMDMTNPKMAKEICQKLSILRARAVIILGDSCDPARGDLKNLAFASVAGGYVRKSRLAERERHAARAHAHDRERQRYDSESIPVPFYVQMDDIPTFDLIKQMEYKIGSRQLHGCVDLGTLGVYIRPFSYYEGWARSIWGAPYAAEPYFPLDFRPLDKDSRIHLVVAGLSKAGEALVIEAIRICHYPRGKPTVITVIDSNPDKETDFRVRHPEVFHLNDVSIDFVCARFQSAPVRSFIAAQAQDRNCLLTVAICFSNIELTMLEGLCLPREVYYSYEPPNAPDGTGRPDHVVKREDYTRDPPRILVYQEHVNGDPEAGESMLPVRYKFVRPFGMQEQGLQTRCMRSFASMYLNAAFFWPIDADGMSFLDPIVESGRVAFDEATRSAICRFSEKWGDALESGRVSYIPAGERYELLKAVLSSGDEMLGIFKRYAFRRFLLMEPVKEWSNVYVPDSYGTILRSVGLTVERLLQFDVGSATAFSGLCERNERLFAEARCGADLECSLEEVEHRRWIADRALMGYRPNRPEDNEVRDDGYRYHNAMRPYAELPDVEKNKRALVVSFIPLFLALEGLEIRPAKTPGPLP